MKTAPNLLTPILPPFRPILCSLRRRRPLSFTSAHLPAANPQVLMRVLLLLKYVLSCRYNTYRSSRPLKLIRFVQ
jgi:hypothetical protein